MFPSSHGAERVNFFERITYTLMILPFQLISIFFPGSSKDEKFNFSDGVDETCRLHCSNDRQFDGLWIDLPTLHFR